MMRTRLLYGAVAIFTLLALAAGFGWSLRQASRLDAAGGQHTLTQRLMERKSEYAAEILSGMATEDYGRIEHGIAGLRKVTVAANLYLLESQYQGSAEEFAESLDQLSRDIQRRDLAAAKLSFDQMTANCVVCHQHVKAGSEAADVVDWQPTRVNPAAQNADAKTEGDAAAD